MQNRFIYIFVTTAWLLLLLSTAALPGFADPTEFGGSSDVGTPFGGGGIDDTPKVNLPIDLAYCDVIKNIFVTHGLAQKIRVRAYSTDRLAVRLNEVQGLEGGEISPDGRYLLRQAVLGHFVWNPYIIDLQSPEGKQWIVETTGMDDLPRINCYCVWDTADATSRHILIAGGRRRFNSPLPCGIWRADIFAPFKKKMISQDDEYTVLMQSLNNGQMWWYTKTTKPGDAKPVKDYYIAPIGSPAQRRRLQIPADCRVIQESAKISPDGNIMVDGIVENKDGDISLSFIDTRKGTTICTKTKLKETENPAPQNVLITPRNVYWLPRSSGVLFNGIIPNYYNSVLHAELCYTTIAGSVEVLDKDLLIVASSANGFHWIFCKGNTLYYVTLGDK